MPPRVIALPALLFAACGGSAGEPAHHVCLDLAEGELVELPEPTTVVAAGLTYAGHLRETGQTRGDAPPIFDKRFSPTREEVPVPTADAQAAAMEALEPGLAARVRERGIAMRPLLDYEVELGLVVLRDHRPGDVPELGFFVANDLSERAVQILGEGRSDRMAYWSASKGFDGFLPTAARMWRPHRAVRDGLPCVRLTTRVNGALRQDQRTDDLAYRTSELLDAAAAFRGGTLEAGAWVLTGTPSGVALATPWWKVMAANLLGLDRFSRLAAVLGGGRFLAAGDEVTVAAEGLGEARVRLVEAPGRPD
jgi:2-keto-4-pentenoate hydratase/2-oxohepta-3-ene-1,7-dioic acid hydratase in catechol pathway